MENWFITPGNPDPYLAPEQTTQLLAGNVYGRTPRFEDGTSITTTVITEVIEAGDDLLVVTKSGTTYKLGKVQEGYELAFPDARNRLITSYKELLANRALQ